MKRWLCSVMMLGIAGVTTAAHAIMPHVHKVDTASVHGLLIEDHSVPMVVCELFMNHAGSAYEPPAQAGLASLTAQMLMEGAGDKDAPAFHAWLDRYAIDMDSYASRDAMHIRFTALSQHQHEAWRAIASMLTQPRFDDEEWNRVHDAHDAALMRAEQQPAARLEQAFYEQGFAGHPYAHPLSGTRTSLKTITPDAMHNFIKNVVGRSSMQLSCSGDVTPKQLQGWLEETLQAVPNHAAQPRTALTPVILKTNKEVVHVKLPAPQTMIRIASPSIGRNHELFYAAYVLNHIVGGSALSSRLGEELRQTRGLTYGVDSSLQALDASPWFSVDFSTQTARAKEGLEAALSTLHTIQDKGITQKELSAAQDYLVGSFALALDSNAGKVAYLSLMQRYKLGTDYLDTRNDRIRSVTLQQIKDAAKVALINQQPLIIWVGEQPYEPRTSNRKNNTGTSHESHSQ